MGPKMSEHFHKLQKFQKTRAIQKCQEVSRIQKCQNIFTNKKDVRKLGQKCRKICTSYKKCQKIDDVKNVGKFAQITKMSEEYFQKWYFQIFDSFALF